MSHFNLQRKLFWKHCAYSNFIVIILIFYTLGRFSDTDGIKRSDELSLSLYLTHSNNYDIPLYAHPSK
jgi:hypothetical protein